MSEKSNENKKQVKSWPPLESNPEAFNDWAQSLGISPKDASFHDCYGLSDDMLEWIIQPCKAVIILFPLSENYEKFRQEQDANRSPTENEDIFFCKQTIRNACGTFALLHSLGNADFAKTNQGTLGKIVRECENKTPLERAHILENSEELEAIHNTVAELGQTQQIDANADVDYHFISYIEHNGHLFELDGRRVAPVDHGPIKRGFLYDTADQVNQLLNITGNILSMITMSPDQ